MAPKKTTKTQDPKAKAAKAANTTPEASAKATKLSAIDAAAKVLGEAGSPMNCQELIEVMAKKGLWTSPGGKTPHATLYSAILREITTKGMRSPYGRAMSQMACVFAELEREMIRERTKDAMSVKRRRRERMSYRAPFGWEFGADITIAKKDYQVRTRQLVIHAAEQAAIRLMKQLRAAGKSYPAIAAELNARGIPTKGGKPWLPTTVWGILARSN